VKDAVSVFAWADTEGSRKALDNLVHNFPKYRIKLASVLEENERRLFCV
jgi:hypothetical protein